jgi:hypothetical protein
MYIVEATSDTPAFKFDAQKGEISIEGVSMPENAFEFFEPIYQELNSSISENSKEYNVQVYLSYMNSMSNKQIIKMIKLILTKAPQSKITWVYSKEDELLKIKGEEIKSIFESSSIVLKEVN